MNLQLKQISDDEVAIPPAFWNEHVVNKLGYSLLVNGAHTKITSTAKGQVVHIDNSVFFRHPWEVKAAFIEDRWNIKIHPGFVNGVAPRIPQTREAIEENGELDLLADEYFPVFEFLARTGAPDARIHRFFQAMGVENSFEKAQAGMSISGASGVEINLDAIKPTEGARSLISCDVWVAVARAALRADQTVVDGGATSGRMVDITARYDMTTINRHGTVPRIQTGRKFPDPRIPADPIDLLRGDIDGDEGEDRIHVATVYWMSPPDGGSNEGAPPASWQPFVEHKIFWNLCHATRNPEPDVIKLGDPIATFTPLAGGTLSLLTNQALSGFNDLVEKVRNSLSQLGNQGAFWSV